MAEELATGGGDCPEPRIPRPLWLAGLGALLTATTLAWLAILVWVAYDNARLDEAHAFEGDGNVPPPAILSGEWWGNAALAFPRIALIAVAYAVPLIAIISVLGRHRIVAGRAALLSGVAAMAPLACGWLFLAALSGHAVPWRVLVLPVLLLAVIGAAGGSVAAAIFKGRDA